VTQPDQVAAALDACEDVFGRPLDTVVNCAGIGLARATLSVKKGGGDDNLEATWRVHDPDGFQNVLRVNVEGTFHVVRLAAERMAKAKAQTDDDDNEDSIPDGVIVNTASIAAYDGQIGQVAYAASKGAIASMTLPLARDLARYNIRANAIAPGLFRTPLLEGLPQQVREELGATVPCPSRLGDPDEFAHLVQSVVENPMINGEVIRIDGALRMPPK
jgi:3-hydroxyacyl-CoA dehydrogenase/3-hydroxy-2-methylbutyryl-CoA dehydrogenase